MRILRIVPVMLTMMVIASCSNKSYVCTCLNYKQPPWDSVRIDTVLIPVDAKSRSSAQDKCSGYSTSYSTVSQQSLEYKTYYCYIK